MVSTCIHPVYTMHIMLVSGIVSSVVLATVQNLKKKLNRLITQFHNYKNYIKTLPVEVKLNFNWGLFSTTWSLNLRRPFFLDTLYIVPCWMWGNQYETIGELGTNIGWCTRLGCWRNITDQVTPEWLAMLLIITGANIFIPIRDIREGTDPGPRTESLNSGRLLHLQLSTREQNNKLKYCQPAACWTDKLFVPIRNIRTIILYWCQTEEILCSCWLVTAQTFPSCQTQPALASLLPSWNSKTNIWW